MIIGSGKKKMLFFEKTFSIVNCFLRSSDGHVTLNIFFDEIFQTILRNKVNLGKPEILSMVQILFFLKN